MSDTERWLRRRVRELRDEELRAAPAYTRPRPRSRAEGVRWGWGLAAAGLAALLAAGLWWSGAESPPAAAEEAAALELAQSLASWEGPLDFLLEVPGAELLGDGPLVPRGRARELLNLVDTEPLGSLEEI